MSREIRILVTGGGTGGHVTPAIAVVRAIREQAQNTDWKPVFRYLGNKRGIESKLAVEADIEFEGVESGKLRRAFNLRGYFTSENIADAFRIPVGIVQALWKVWQFHPHVVLSTGGYVSVPPVIAAWLLRVPVITHEQTVQMGLANRITARFARTIALTFEGAAQELSPRLRRKTRVTGNPVRSIIFKGDREKAIARSGFDPIDNHLPTLYVTGGAQGARIINRAIEAVLGELLPLCRIMHQCGQQPAGDEQDYDRLAKVESSLPEQLRHRYWLTRFVGDEIGDVFALTDLVISRAGAGTVTEVSALGKPTIFIPLVPTGGDEQTRNAKRSVEAGAAVIIPQAELNGVRLLDEIKKLLKNTEQLETMGKAARTLARPNAAHDLAQVVLQAVL
ncbi:MAG: undecaprenyldiphospho-muramoylpentapeptide beta-N-acetylglucosaminyltransferase [Chloroflexi bacterium]|uniref:UDP-N-acetylglucosamine--N-acetylmuramyl-(pentapeptide) pyrophosphoryl-undecaprenol N-acetylglucosamine transferase n=1 Tax=Candidatus Chlorohelix allophototropha TaxID=3003348 RepID=A0A8T7M0P2_9CHLR|nr:undecaprenyldiphospho-muramoylpentapeptide beta-N-acetylglucosaminyltransferase [Chloroflexota bacterium]WJW66872.1 undecaprenyldiphospho-muramoylpentapeptide beta-N-acetylglucosaminyltransferase [Chloroflexota bacterium L227-S17]